MSWANVPGGGGRLGKLISGNTTAAVRARVGGIVVPGRPWAAFRTP
jgi:hypothetical protein